MKVKKIIKNQFLKKLRKKGIKIGNNCEISRNVCFGSEPYLISIGDNVRITNGCKFFTHDGSLWVLRNLGKVDKNADKIRPIKIGNNVNIGWNTMIMPGITIGDNVISGAGSIITKNVPSNSVVAGVPARIIETLDEYCDKVSNNLILTKGMNKEEKKAYLLSMYGDSNNEK